jgi:hypothetical protein
MILDWARIVLMQMVRLLLDVGDNVAINAEAGNFKGV